jgi:hypothetical protein
MELLNIMCLTLAPDVLLQLQICSDLKDQIKVLGISEENLKIAAEDHVKEMDLLKRQTDEKVSSSLICWR